MCQVLNVALTDAVDARVVQVVAERTLAAERAVRVDAQAVATDSRVFNALVHVCAGREHISTTYYTEMSLSWHSNAKRFSHPLDLLRVSARLRDHKDTKSEKPLWERKNERTLLNLLLSFKCLFSPICKHVIYYIIYLKNLFYFM